MRGNPINRLEHAWRRRSVPQDAQSIAAPTFAERAQTWETKLKDLIIEHPQVALATAAAVGLLVGWMVKRR